MIARPLFTEAAEVLTLTDFGQGGFLPGLPE